VPTLNEVRHDELKQIWARLDHLVVGSSVAPMLPEARTEYEALVDREYSLLAVYRADEPSPPDPPFIISLP
jgi:hypothetical protein